MIPQVSAPFPSSSKIHNPQSLTSRHLPLLPRHTGYPQRPLSRVARFGYPYFVLSGCVALKATGSTMKGLPEGSKMTEDFLKMSFVSSFPVDPSLPIWSGNVDWDLEIAADVPTRNGKTAKFKLISKQTTEVAQKPVK
jgi:hypothetical protein